MEQLFCSLTEFLLEMEFLIEGFYMDLENANAISRLVNVNLDMVCLFGIGKTTI